MLHWQNHWQPGWTALTRCSPESGIRLVMSSIRCHGCLPLHASRGLHCAVACAAVHVAELSCGPYPNICASGTCVHIRRVPYNPASVAKSCTSPFLVKVRVFQSTCDGGYTSRGRCSLPPSRGSIIPSAVQKYHLAELPASGTHTPAFPVLCWHSV